MRLGPLRGWTEPKPHLVFVARVHLPLRFGPDMADAAFVTPLDRALVAEGLGRVSDHGVSFDEAGEPASLHLDLSLATPPKDVFPRIIASLEGLDAPAGSTIGNPEGTDLVQFGKSEGLGIYFPAREVDETTRLAAVEACTDALSGDGIYQGSHSFGELAGIYFYGDSFNRMRSALTFLLSHDPRFKNAYARRLT